MLWIYSFKNEGNAATHNHSRQLASQDLTQVQSTLTLGFNIEPRAPRFCMATYVRNIQRFIKGLVAIQQKLLLLVVLYMCLSNNRNTRTDDRPNKDYCKTSFTLHARSDRESNRQRNTHQTSSTKNTRRMHAIDHTHGEGKGNR